MSKRPVWLEWLPKALKSKQFSVTGRYIDGPMLQLIREGCQHAETTGFSFLVVNEHL